MDKNMTKNAELFTYQILVQFYHTKVAWAGLDLSNFAVSFVPITSADNYSSAYKNLNEYFNITK